MVKIQPLILISIILCFSLIPGPVSATTANNGLTVNISPPSSFIRGGNLEIAGTGQSSSEIQLWLFKPHYLNIIRKKTLANGDFDIVLDKIFTDDLESGSYIILIQSQGPDNKFDLLVNSTGDVINRKKTGPEAILFTKEQAETMGDELAAQLVIGELNTMITDDPYEKFQVEMIDPFIRIDPIPDVCLGENVTITGTTNIPTGEQLIIDISRGPFSSKMPIGYIGQQSGPVTIQNGSGGINFFRTVIQYNSSVTPSGVYVVFVTCCYTDRTSKGTVSNFSLLPCMGALPENNTPTPATPTPSITPKSSPIIGLLPVAFIIVTLILRRMKSKEMK